LLYCLGLNDTGLSSRHPISVNARSYFLGFFTCAWAAANIKDLSQFFYIMEQISCFQTTVDKDNLQVKSV